MQMFEVLRFVQVQKAMQMFEVLRFVQVQEAMKVAAPDIVRDIQKLILTQAPAGYEIVATPDQIKELLFNDTFITFSRGIYDQFVKNQFKGNSIMINKWLRYADNINSI